MCCSSYISVDSGTFLHVANRVRINSLNIAIRAKRSAFCFSAGQERLESECCGATGATETRISV